MAESERTMLSTLAFAHPLGERRLDAATEGAREEPPLLTRRSTAACARHQLLGKGAAKQLGWSDETAKHRDGVVQHGTLAYNISCLTRHCAAQADADDHIRQEAQSTDSRLPF